MTVVFYDTETTGTNTSFDQILQFAAIQTDTELNEVDRFEMRCRILPYITPSPGAMRVTGATVSQISDLSLPSCYEMVGRIRGKLLEMGTDYISRIQFDAIRRASSTAGVLQESISSVSD